MCKRNPPLRFIAPPILCWALSNRGNPTQPVFCLTGSNRTRFASPPVGLGWLGSTGQPLRGTQGSPRAHRLMYKFDGGRPPRPTRPRWPLPRPVPGVPPRKADLSLADRATPHSVCVGLPVRVKGTLCSMNAHWHLPIATACHCTSRSFAGVLLTCPMKGMLRGGSPQQRVWHSPHHIQIGQQLLPMCQSTIAFTGHLASCCGACMWNSTGATKHPRRMSNMASSRPLVALQ